MWHYNHSTFSAADIYNLKLPFLRVMGVCVFFLGSRHARCWVSTDPSSSQRAESESWRTERLCDRRAQKCLSKPMEMVCIVSLTLFRGRCVKNRWQESRSHLFVHVHDCVLGTQQVWLDAQNTTQNNRITSISYKTWYHHVSRHGTIKMTCFSEHGTIVTIVGTTI